MVGPDLPTGIEDPLIIVHRDYRIVKPTLNAGPGAPGLLVTVWVDAATGEPRCYYARSPQHPLFSKSCSLDCRNRTSDHTMTTDEWCRG